MANLGATWDDLPPDLLSRIAVCTSWRAALRRPSPSLLVSGYRISALCLSPKSSTMIHQGPISLFPTTRCLGSGNGWVVIYKPCHGWLFSSRDISLLNLFTCENIPFQCFPKKKMELFNDPFLYPFPNKLKIVFAPNPTPSDFTAAVVITGGTTVTYTDRGGSGEDLKVQVYCLTIGGDVHVLNCHRQRTASFVPLFDKSSMEFYPAVAFAQPYDKIRNYPNTKNLLRETLKYYPRRRPCWVVVEDLNGHSFFVGKNNAVALYVDGDGGTPWLKSNCVYWIDDSLGQAKVFDMKTGKSQSLPGAIGYNGNDYAICWCNLGDTRSNTHGSVATSGYHLAKRARHSSTVIYPNVAISLFPIKHCVGAGNGWVAIYKTSLKNLFTGQEIPLHCFSGYYTFTNDLKVVFAPNPTPSVFTAAAIAGNATVTYTTEENSGWIKAKCPRLAQEDGITDVVYHEKGGSGDDLKVQVYCLTRGGDVHVLNCRRQRAAATFEPLFDKGSTDFYPTVAFAQPYNMIRNYANVKNLVVCDDGHIYLIWRKSNIGTTALSDGGECCVEKNQIFVLRYYPRRRPCWVAVKELNGHSFFIGKNNAVALYVDGGTPLLRSNCMYWIDDSLEQTQVFDMKTGKSQCFPSAAQGYFHRNVMIWCNLGDTWSNTHGSVATSGYQLAKRVRHV
uniref:KIB1-4 beta-propeller domain-containing protein n=1 Tax=Leersia perrieri TaxID=77586 RepID=A0A0D9X3Z9_9ORYZ